MRRGLRGLVAVIAAASLAGASPLGAPAAGSTTANGPPPVVTVDAPAGGSSTSSAATTPGAPAPDPTADPGTPAVPAPLPQPQGRTTLVSVGLVNASAPGYSTTPSISSSGRYVAFATVHTSAVVGASFNTSTVYLRDRSNGTTVQIPPPAGSPSGGYATEPSISADGSVIAFTYGTTPDPAAPHSVVVWDRKTGKTTVVSRPTDAPDASYQPAVSGNGRYVAYASTAPRLIPGYTSDFSDIWRFDRQTGQTVLVSVPLSSGIVKGDSTAPSISDDGHLVAFTSTGSTSLAANAVGPGTQVFLRDVDAGTTTQVSIGSDGSAPDGASDEPSLSDNGQYLAFASVATTMLGPGGATTWEVYRRDLGTGQNELVSARDDGTPFPSASRQPAISRDGRMVAYALVGASLTAVAQRQTTAILLRDTTAQQTALITVTTAGVLSQSTGLYPRVGGSGRFVTFASGGADLVAGDTNNSADVFIRDMPPIPKLAPPTIDFGTRAVGVSPSTAAGVLTNAGWGPMTMQPAAIAGTNAADFSVLGDVCSGVTLYRGDPCTVTVGFTPQQPGARTATLQIAMNAPGSPAVLTLMGRGSQAGIVLNPPNGQQGIVVVATGDHFPANAEIQLTWSTGITPNLPVVKADSHGHWQIQVLVFHHDVSGPRNLVATWVGGPEFPTMQVPMLVTVRSVMPPGFNIGGPSKNQLPMLFRG